MSLGPYGYTLTVWTSGAVLVHALGVPDAANALLFMLGGVAAFGLVGLAAHGRLRSRIGVEEQQPALWAGFHVLSIGAAIGAVSLVARGLHDRGAWPLGGFAATACYLVLLAAQLAVGG